MPSFFVDPLVCTVPAETASSQELGDWLQALDGWLIALDSSPFSWKNAIQCTEKIVEHGRFPDFDSLRRMKAAAKVDVNINYLLQRVNRFFQNNVHDLYTTIPTQVALAESAPTIEPAEFIMRNVTDVQPVLVDALVCLALDKSRKDAFAREARIVTRPFKPEHRKILVRAENVEVEPPNTHESRIENTFAAVFTPRDLSDFLYESLLEGESRVSSRLFANSWMKHFPE